MPEPIRARVFKGTRDLMPEEMIPRQRMLTKMRSVFERFGFAPVETPVMEHLDILLGKYGEEGEKLIYPLAYKGGRQLALRYDLTVPLSRLVAMRPELPLPFKRYQIQPVYRADRPQPAQGRFREFYQCDVDSVGTASLVADAENIAVCHEIYQDLGLVEAGIEMRLNNRKILGAIVEAAGLGEDMDHVVFTILDKIDKIGREEVESELEKKNIDAATRARLFEIIDLGDQIGATRHLELLDALDDRLANTRLGGEGVSEMRELFGHLAAMDVPADALSLDLVLTRGLDYYTGPIYEFRTTAADNFGSLGGGGRYDDIMGLYGKGDVPATGVSIGLSRVQSLLEKLGLIEAAQTPTRGLVLRFDDVPVNEALGLVTRLRREGTPVELFDRVAQFGKQIAYADKRGIPFVLIQGRREIESGMVQVKDIRVGEQSEVPVDQVSRILSAT